MKSISTLFIPVFSPIVLSLVALATFAVAFTPQVAVAQVKSNAARCGRDVKECFMHVGEDRSGCFYLKSRSVACKDTEIGSLTLQRWALSPGSEIGSADAGEITALTGPRLVDPECISQFDTVWSSYLMRDDVSGSTIKMLRDALSRCDRVDVEELPNP